MFILRDKDGGELLFDGCHSHELASADFETLASLLIFLRNNRERLTVEACDGRLIDCEEAIAEVQRAM